MHSRPCQTFQVLESEEGDGAENTALNGRVYYGMTERRLNAGHTGRCRAQEPNTLRSMQQPGSVAMLRGNLMAGHAGTAKLCAESFAFLLQK